MLVIRMVAWRVAGAVPLVLGVASLVFLLLHLAPGDPASIYAGSGVSPEALAQIRSNMGLDAPLHVRYGKWLAALVRGNLGVSTGRGEPVLGLLISTLPATLLLSGASLILAFLLGVGVGVVQAVRKGGILDAVLGTASLFFYAMPSFWLAVMLLLLFSLQARLWGWPVVLPASGTMSVNHDLMGGWEQVHDRIRHLVLPVVSLTLVLAGGVARYVRGSMVEVLREDYIRAARARGIPEWRVVLLHALPNALLPIITLAGLHLPLLLGGAVFVETVFAWPGMGKLLVDGILMRDYPVVLAGSLAFALVVVAGNLVADLLYRVADPRVRQGGST